MMKHPLTALLENISTLVIIVLVVSIPLFFAPLTTEFFETPKLILLTIGVVVLLIILATNWLISARVHLAGSPFDLPLVMLLLTLVISTIFTPAKWVAVLGNLPNVHNSLVAWVVYILFYFLLINSLKRVSQVKAVVYLLLLVAVILAILSLASYVGVYLPFTFAKSPSFTPTGSAFSTTALVALLLPLPLIELLSTHHRNLYGYSPAVLKPFWVIILSLFAATLVLTGSLSSLIAALVALLLTLLSMPQNAIKNSYLYLIAPAVITLLLAVLSFAKLPGLGTSPLAIRTQAFSKELQLPFVSSWKVSVSAFRDAPFFGTGPASYLFDFSLYKPIEFNQHKLWNIRFDQAFNQYLEVLATLGGTGLLSLLLLTVIFSSLALRHLIWGGQVIDNEINLTTYLSLAGIVWFVILALHPATLPVWFVGILILAAFVVASNRVSSVSSLNFSSLTHLPDAAEVLEALPGVLLIIVLLSCGAVLFFAGRFALADYYHRQALNAVTRGSGIDAYNNLVKAETLNPNVDLYRSDLAQTNFALANAIAASKSAPAQQASASGSLTAQDTQNIQTLLSQAIAEGRKATELSPNNPLNWEVLGSIYRQIAGVAQNALQFALDSYGRAIQKDPFNPALRLSAGGIYYSVKNFDLAIRLFTDSIALKPDYANGFYNLAVALSDKGDVKSAITAAEKVVSLIDPSSQDYKVATDLLNSLKSKKEGTSSTTPPAAQSSSALNKENLPKVIELPKPEKIATPPAVKASPNPTPNP